MFKWLFLRQLSVGFKQISKNLTKAQLTTSLWCTRIKTHKNLKHFRDIGYTQDIKLALALTSTVLLDAWCWYQYNYGQCINISTRSHPPEALGWTLTVMITESTSRILIGQLIPIMSSDWFQWWNYLWILDIITSVILYRLQQACHLVSFLHSLMINCIQTFLHQACHVIIVFLGLKICVCSPNAHWQRKKAKRKIYVHTCQSLKLFYSFHLVKV